MNKKFFILGMILCLLLTGCSLAVEDAAAPVEEDALIGVLVTTEHLDLFDTERYFQENAAAIVNGGEVKNSEAYQGRIYAKRVQRELTGENGEKRHIEEFEFEGYEGMAYMAATMEDENGEYVSTQSSSLLSDGHTAVISRDNEERRELSATLYVGPDAKHRAYYCNPIYQTADGQVYVTSGQGISSNFDWESMKGAAPGPEMTTTISNSVTETVDGVSKTRSFSASISIAPMLPGDSGRIVEMDSENRALRSTELDINALPEDYTPGEDCEYLLLQLNWEKEIHRRLYQQGEPYLEIFTQDENGICTKSLINILWEKAD